MSTSTAQKFHVGVATCATQDARYPDTVPYNPDTAFPEYPFAGHVSPKPNMAYRLVREAFIQLRLDAAHIGTAEWNPLGSIISPGMRVVIKPNWVLSRHHEKGDLWSVITHPSVMRAIADYCWIALKGKGTVDFADAPQYNCNFEELMSATKMREVAAFLSQQGEVAFSVIDLRNYWSPRRHQHSLIKPLPGDPRGSYDVDLGAESALQGKDSRGFYGAVYHRQETIAHHSGGKHEYRLSRTHHDADVFISVPKLKVHKKVGVTLNAKGLVGTATNKNHLLHYSLKTPDKGGDQFPVGWLTPWESFVIGVERWMYDTFLARRNKYADYIHRGIYWLKHKTLTPLGISTPKYKRVLDAGNWHGNDSAWRMTLDLLRAIYFAKQGVMQKTKARRTFSIIDGIIGGDNRGPLEPDAVPSGIILAGEDLIATDLVATRLMGFDPMKVRTYHEAIHDRHFQFGVTSYDDIIVHADDPSIRNCLTDSKSRFFDYLPHPGWVGQLEIDTQPKAELDFEKAVHSSLERSKVLRLVGR